MVLPEIFDSYKNGSSFPLVFGRRRRDCLRAVWQPWITSKEVETVAILRIADKSQYPNVTWPDAISPNPAAVAGAQSNQQSPPKYPSPWGTGAGDWADAYKKAISMVEQMTLEEKVNLTTGKFPHLLHLASSADRTT